MAFWDQPTETMPPGERLALQMARIRACNMAMFFFIMPVSSFITFAAVCLASTHDPKHSPELTFLALIHVDSLQ